MLDVPVVLVAFNRPDKLRRTLDRVRAAAPDRLFLLADAPRPDRPDDAERCAAVREVLATVDWDCRVERYYAETNLGCEASVELGLDRVFSSVDRAIVLEDDCLPDPTFFRYCAELLERYADDERVWQIAGNSYTVPKEFFGGDSYAFSPFASVWGWATWSRAWKAHRAVFTRDHATAGAFRTMPPERTEPALIPRGALETASGHRYFTEVAATTDGTVFSWDSHWWVSMLTHGGLAVSPAVNLVENIGFDGDATYTRTDRPQPKAEPMPFPLVHPAVVAVNPAVAREIELETTRSGSKLARTLGRLLGDGHLRRLARKVSTWGVTRGVRRTVSRLSAAVRRGQS